VPAVLPPQICLPATQRAVIGASAPPLPSGTRCFSSRPSTCTWHEQNSERRGRASKEREADNRGARQSRLRPRVANTNGKKDMPVRSTAAAWTHPTRCRPMRPSLPPAHPHADPAQARAPCERVAERSRRSWGSNESSDGTIILDETQEGYRRTRSYEHTIGGAQERNLYVGRCSGSVCQQSVISFT
jgi:hypothetical protein